MRHKSSNQTELSTLASRRPASERPPCACLTHTRYHGGSSFLVAGLAERGNTPPRLRRCPLRGLLVGGRAERGNMPPRLRRCPLRGLLVASLAERGTCPPRLRRCPPKRGAITWLLERLCFAPGRFEICGELHEGAKREPRRPNPRQEAHQTWGAAPKARGAGSHVLQNPQQEAHLWGAAPKARGACPRFLLNLPMGFLSRSARPVSSHLA
jgi:hypothetical protein